MATIAYDEDGDDGGGNLFAGKKFFILKRVPSRDKWVNLVKSNAGKIVKLEQQADFIIADHARKDCPAGSVSWKFIEASVKAGELKDAKLYPAGSSTHTPRAAGSGQPTRQSRTPFTAEDDRILADWVLEAECIGAPTKGNELFKRLEEKNNRHTYQSWRDRWVKYLSQRPRPNTEHILPATPPARPRPIAPRDQPDQRPALRSKVPNERVLSSQRSVGSGSQAQPHIPRLPAAPATLASSGSPTGSVRSPRVGDARSYITKSHGGMDFTHEEIGLLLEEATDIINLDEDQTIDAWITWAVNYPNHTAQEWRNCFAEVVAPRMLETTNEQAEKSTYSGSKSKRVSTTRPRSGSSDQKSYGRATDLNMSLSANETPGSQKATENASQFIMEEEEFKKELTGIAKGLDLTLDLNPVICGRTVPIYRLWKIVWSDEFGGFNEVTRKRLWARVARKLNFNDYQHSSAAKELESCYNNILLPLDAGQEAYETTELSESEEQQMIEAQLLKTAARETQNPTEPFVDDEVERESLESVDNLSIHLPPPRQHSHTYSGKRPLEIGHSNQGGSSQVRSSNKRQRIDKGKGKELEIPSTPEPISESDQLTHSSHRVSQLEDARLIDLDEVEEGSKPESYVTPSKHVNQSHKQTPAARRRTEPETQEFHFAPEQYDEATPLSSKPSSHPRRTRNENQSLAARSKPPPGNTSAPPKTVAQPTTELDLNSFMERYISLGYSGSHIIQALEATTMNTGDAGIVMERLRSSNRIPRNIQGVWTSSDDEAVKEEDHPRFDNILEKHGITRVAVRRRFLADQKAAKEQLRRCNVEP